MKQTIFITGTPSIGKTTLADNLDCKVIKINELAIKHDFVLGTDEIKGYKVIDIDALDEKVSEIISQSNELLVFEGHLSHLCSGADKVIVLRANPEVLRPRLEKRGYSKSKIRENLEAEALGVCSQEAYEKHGAKVQEIDVSDLNVGEVISLVKDVINGDKNYPFGEIDYMDWFVINH